MLKWVGRFEVWINWAVLLMMALVVLMLTVGFAVELGRDIIGYPAGVLTKEEAFAIFGDLLLILIGLELMNTVKVYLEDHTVSDLRYCRRKTLGGTPMVSRKRRQRWL